MQSLTYVEVDLDYCGLTYGQAPCLAALGVTGDRKCFNTVKTCQDRENFNRAPGTNFGEFTAQADLPAGWSNRWSSAVQRGGDHRLCLPRRQQSAQRRRQYR
ncbi:MAG: hypothetical protein R6X03_05330 [Methyloceanibacter sp.]